MITLSETEYIIGLGAILFSLVAWCIRKYRVIMADGKVTLQEILDLVRAGRDEAEEVLEDIEELED